MSAYLSSYVFPLLVLALGLQYLGERLFRSASRRRRGILSCAAAFFIGCIPVDGLPLARWPASANASFCIPFTLVVLNGIWNRTFGNPLMNGPALRAAWIFGLVGGGILYPMALGWGSWDPYVAGYGSIWLFAALWLVTILLLLRKNGFGTVLVLAALAFNLRILDSENAWDYYIDPIYTASSLAAMGVPLVKKVFNSARTRLRGIPPHPRHD